MAAIVRRALRLGARIDAANAKLLQSRCLSNAAQAKVVEGTNGEKIIASPYGQVTYPDISITEYVWKSLNNHERMIALVSKKY